MLSENDQKSPLHNMFQSVPERYDILNKILTLTLDSVWRAHAAAECLKNSPARVLDLCCGTGDLAINIARQSSYNNEITGLDYSQNMLNIARKKAGRLCDKKISFICADAAGRTLPDNYFDVIGISFAFRNLTFRNRNCGSYLKEVLRMLKTNGRFVIIETGQPPAKIIRKIYHFYFKYFVSPVGGFLSGRAPAYRYLASSAVNYFDNDSMAVFLKSRGFRNIECKPYLFGAVNLHTAEK